MGNESDAREKRDIFHVRIKMLCANNQLYATKAMPSGFVPPYTQKEGLARTLEFEFVRTIEDAVEFVSEEICESWWCLCKITFNIDSVLNGTNLLN